MSWNKSELSSKDQPDVSVQLLQMSAARQVLQTLLQEALC